MTPEQRDRYFALNVRFSAALYRGDENEAEQIGDELDHLWKQIGNKAEQEWIEACYHIAKCVKQWPNK